MRAEFSRTDDPETVIGTAEWDGGRAIVRADRDEDRAVLDRIFRVSAVATAAPQAGTVGPGADVVVAPGDVGWFRAAAIERGRQEGLSVRFVTSTPGGWDPAGSYEPMHVFVGRKEGDLEDRTSLGTSRA